MAPMFKADNLDCNISCKKDLVPQTYTATCDKHICAYFSINRINGPQN